ncbi:biotin carboxylase [Streptomyces sp. NRRL B-24720]|uniref:ATP-grasp domain-containing protein n=1 Tax=Streptomyces sp. NRRL B-24720 TaxID=1476876 RepID=UPI001F25AE9F|nr:biotin carboxylase [Streptomyces sp. NRRL B-24720]
MHAPIADGPAILEVLRPLHEERPFDRVLTTTEPAAESTGYVVDAMGLTGVTEATARALKDKALTRELLANYDLSPVRHQVVHSAEEASGFQRSVGGRIVLKPVDGVAGLHIHPAANADEAARAWRDLAADGYDAPIAEEYLEGPVASVDSFPFDGRHVPIGYSEYRMNERFGEWEVSTPSRAAAPHLAELPALTVQLLDAVGLTEGPSHSEFVLTPQDPRVLESHARLSGSGAPELVRCAFGVDLNRWFLTVPLGIDELPAASPEPVGDAAVRFFTPQPGQVRAVEVATEVRRVPRGETPLVFLLYLDEFRQLPAAAVIAKSPGDTVPEPLTVADCVSGYVIASGVDREAAVTRCEEIDKNIRFLTDRRSDRPTN